MFILLISSEKCQSSFSITGYCPKGKIVFEEANLAEFITEYHAMKIEKRTRRQAKEPTFPLSFPTN